MDKMKVGDTVIIKQDADIFKQADLTKIVGLCRGCGGVIVEGSEEHFPPNIFALFDPAKPVENLSGDKWYGHYMSLLLALTKILAHGQSNNAIYASVLQECMKMHMMNSGVDADICNYSPEDNKWEKK